MRIPRGLAWLLVAMGTFTAGLLRQFHEVTPTAPFLAPAVGSLLFACLLFLVLVAARERQVGAAPGPGVRLGSVTPFLLMLLFEKWVSSTAYQPLFAWAAPERLSPAAADAWFRALCGLGLLAVVVVETRFSAPAAAWVAARLSPRRVAPGLGAAVASILCAYALLGALSLASGVHVGILPPTVAGPVLVVVLGQAALALAEEVYFRGLILGELLRLMPRLGVRSAPARRWVALGVTSMMFAMEHVSAAASPADSLRAFVFAGALGLLFGLLVLVTANLWMSTTLHAWINWLLLGATPRLSYGSPDAGLAPGVYIFIALIVAFVAAFLGARRAQPPAR